MGTQSRGMRKMALPGLEEAAELIGVREGRRWEDSTVCVGQ